MTSSTLPIAALGKRLRATRIDAYDAIAWLGSAALLVACIAFADDAGVTMDEKVEAGYGRRILTWYGSGFRDTRALNSTAQSQYGGLYAAVVGAMVHFLPFDEYVIRHFFAGVCGVLGIAAAWRCAALLGGPRAGLCAGSMLALTPAWLGHALFNPKDTPFGAAAAWALYGTLRIATDRVPPKRSVCLLCGVATGAALGVRPGGMFLLAYPALVMAARLWLLREPNTQRLSLLARSSARLALGLGAAWITMLIAWPWALMSPLLRPFQAANMAAHFSWNGSVRFRGAIVDVHALPRDYLPTWFAITLPETYVLAAVCALLLLWAVRKRTPDSTRLLALATLFAAAFGPLAVAVLTQPVIYDAHRHFLFLMPAMAALAGYAVAEFSAAHELPRAARVTALGAWIALCALTLHDMVAMHPYEYSYFNRLSGSLAGASQRFETDYWGASYEEGVAWVVSHLQPAAGTRLRISSCHDLEALAHYFARTPEAAARFQIVKERSRADVFLTTTRNDCHKSSGTIIHTIQRMGAPLLYVLRTNPS